jgi:hypothetical protein
MKLKRTMEEILFDSLMNELEFIHGGHSKKSMSNRRIRELLWDIHYHCLSGEIFLSEEYVKEMKNGIIDTLGKYTGEHKIPVKVLTKVMVHVYKTDIISDTYQGKVNGIKNYLRDNLIIAKITEDEERNLRDAGLTSSLPIDGSDRYASVGIKIDKNNVIRNGVLTVISDTAIEMRDTYNSVKVTTMAPTSLFEFE